MTVFAAEETETAEGREALRLPDPLDSGRSPGLTCMVTTGRAAIAWSANARNSCGSVWTFSRAATSSIRLANSSAVWIRAPGSCFKALSTKSRRGGATRPSGSVCSKVSSRPLMCAATIDWTLWPGSGQTPVSISESTMPNENRSLRPSRLVVEEPEASCSGEQ